MTYWPDKSVIFKFNSAIPCNKWVVNAIALRYEPDIFYGKKQRTVISFSMMFNEWFSRLDNFIYKSLKTIIIHSDRFDFCDEI